MPSSDFGRNCSFFTLFYLIIEAPATQKKFSPKRISSSLVSIQISRTDVGQEKWQ